MPELGRRRSLECRKPRLGRRMEHCTPSLLDNRERSILARTIRATALGTNSRLMVVCAASGHLRQVEVIAAFDSQLRLRALIHSPNFQKDIGVFLNTLSRVHLLIYKKVTLFLILYELSRLPIHGIDSIIVNVMNVNSCRPVRSVKAAKTIPK